jgi:acetoacetyl-CoA synthetase
MPLLIAKTDADGGMIGVRFGSAEIYGVIEKLSEIVDSLCVGQKLPPDFRDEQVLLFVKMVPGTTLDDQLKSKIRREVANALSARHVPARIHQVVDVPYTVNGKRIENLVRDIVDGKSVGEARTAINPECLEEYRAFAFDRRGKSSKL